MLNKHPIIPNDLLSVNTTSCLRLGTCACTSRGLRRVDFEWVTNMEADVLLEIRTKGGVSLPLEMATRKPSVGSYKRVSDLLQCLD